MIILTERLRLRPMEPKDIDSFVRDLSDWEVQQWLDRPPFPYQRKDGEVYMGIVQRNHATSHPTLFVIADKVSDAALGTAGVDIDGEGTGALGYWLGRVHWGHGIMQEAVAALVRYAQGHPAVRRLSAVTDPDNVRSQRVLAASGLVDRGLATRPQLSRPGSIQIREYELPI
jgi:RimJ/RimL family protein N-acetyltransferase